MLCNAPAALLRKKSKQFPQGRTSIPFKAAMRNKVTIIGKSMFKSQQKKEEDHEEKPKPFVATEQNYKETAEEDDEDHQTLEQ